MEFEKDTSANTFSHFPTRCLKLVVDPKCVLLLREWPYIGVFQLIRDLKDAIPQLDINVIVPSYLTDTPIQNIAGEVKQFIKFIDKPSESMTFEPAKEMHKDDRNSLMNSGGKSERVLNLLALADEVQADALITTADILLCTRYPIYHHHCINVIPLDEFADVVEVFAHGHLIFWSASNYVRLLRVEIFYPETHWKNARLSRWFNATQNRLPNNEIKENLQNIVFNRYPFLLYSRDMVRFFQLQRDYYSRRGLYQSFGLLLAFYVNTFHFMLWGLLEQLTLIAKYARDLDVAETNCGIRSKEFWREFGPKEQGLKTFIKNDPIKKWIDELADMRHAAAHKMIPMPAPLVVQTEDSKKSDEEIVEILKKEIPVLYSLGSEGTIKALEPLHIFHWRRSKMRTIGQHVVHIKRRDGMYTTDPVISVDYNLERANAVLDAFLVCLFR